MTLIITAICRNGISICADKRNKIINRDGSVEIKNNFNKIYRFPDIPLIICNHGVNKFNGRLWDSYCSEYATSSQWKNKNLSEIVDDFKNFMEKDVLLELENNRQNIPNMTDTHRSFFLLSGKTHRDGNYKVYEISWPSGKINGNWSGELIGSGVGYDNYLKRYQTSDESNKVGYWKSKGTQLAAYNLKRLFQIAVEKQKYVGGDDFSDNYDIKCIP